MKLAIKFKEKEGKTCLVVSPQQYSFEKPACYLLPISKKRALELMEFIIEHGSIGFDPK